MAINTLQELQLYLLQLVQALRFEGIIEETEETMEASKQPTSKQAGLASDSALAQFLIDRAVENPSLGNNFYWFVSRI